MSDDHLYAAAVAADLKAIKLAIKNGADIHKNDDAVLRYLCSKPGKTAERLRTLRYLHHAGANMKNVSVGYPAECGHLPIVGYIDKHRISSQDDYDQALHQAAANIAGAVFKITGLIGLDADFNKSQGFHKLRKRLRRKMKQVARQL